MTVPGPKLTQFMTGPGHKLMTILTIHMAGPGHKLMTILTIHMTGSGNKLMTTTLIIHIRGLGPNYTSNVHQTNNPYDSTRTQTNDHHSHNS